MIPEALKYPNPGDRSRQRGAIGGSACFFLGFDAASPVLTQIVQGSTWPLAVAWRRKAMGDAWSVPGPRTTSGINLVHLAVSHGSWVRLRIARSRVVSVLRKGDKVSKVDNVSAS